MAFEFLTDAFTGRPAQQAAQNQRNFLDQTRTTGLGTLQDAADWSKNYIATGTNAARDALTTGFGAANRYATQGPDQANAIIDSGTRDALTQLGDTRTLASQALQPLSALGNKYGLATNTALGALGVNGQDAQTQAFNQFRASPAYNFNLDQGLDAINRRRTAAGMLNSGNADQDAQKFGAGLASNEYNNWYNNLAAFTNPELAATSTAATGNANAALQTGIPGAQMISNAGTLKAGNENTRTAMLADIARQYGTSLAGLEQGQGQNLANLTTGAAQNQVGLTQNLAQPYAQTYGNEAAAQMQGSGNFWNLAQNAARLGVSAMTGLPTSMPGVGAGAPNNLGSLQPFGIG